MKIVCIVLLIVLLNSCSEVRICTDTSILPVFIKFLPADIDTLVIRKYDLNANFQHPIDSSLVIAGYFGYYITNNDSTTVQLFSEKLKIENGFDWQIYIPAKNRFINISNIQSEKTTRKFYNSIFDTKKVYYTCENQIFSCQQNGQLINFNTGRPYNIYITN
jgi:hypothetical protein